MAEGETGIWSKYQRAVGSIDRNVNHALGLLGAFVARRPVLTIVLSSIFALACTSGLVLIGERVETESDKLWVPQNSVWFDHENYLEPRLGANNLFVQMIFQEKSEGSNVITEAGVRDMFKAYQAVTAVTVEKDGRTYSWEDGICWKAASGRCRETGIIVFFNSDLAEFERVAAQGDQALRQAISAATYPDGAVVTQERLLMDAQKDSNDTFLSASMSYYAGQIDPNLADGVIDKWNDAVEDVFWADGSDTFAAFSTRFAAVDLHFLLPNSVDSAISESVAGDIILIAIAVVVICTFVGVVFFIRDAVFTRTTLALLGCLCIALSIGAGFGLSFYLGVPFTSITQVLPFILLGIGVDDLFVILRSLEEVDELHPGLPMEERFRKVLNGAGLSVSVTSLSNIAAFTMGSITEIPAVRWFCWTAAISIAMDWLLQLTFFLGCLVLTERRIAAARYDFFCCWKRSPRATLEAVTRAVTVNETAHGTNSSFRTTFPTAPADSMRRATSAALAADEAAEKAGDAKVDDASARKIPVGFLSSNKDSWLQLFLNKYLFSVVYSLPGKIVIVGIVICGVILGAIGITRLDEGLPLSSLAPDGHYLKTFIDLNDQIDRNSGLPTKILFRNVEQSELEIQRKMARAHEAALDADYISRELSSPTTWLSELQAYAARQQPANVTADGAVEPAAFYALLDEFLVERPIYQDSIHFIGAPGGRRTIEVSFFDVTHIADPEGDQGYERKLINDMHDMQSRINGEVFADENAATDGADVFFVFGDFYKFFETDRIIFREMLLNLGYAMLGIVIISVLLLISPRAVVTIVLCIAVVDLFLFAEMWLFNIRLNTVSVVNLTMAIGLSVDYSLHILHTFLHKGGASKEARARTSMLEIGAAVLLGATSTLLGVVVLAGSSSEIIRIFFKLLMGTVIFGAFVGMFFLPVLLSLVGPPPCLLKAAPREDDLAHEAQDRGDEGSREVDVRSANAPAV